MVDKVYVLADNGIVADCLTGGHSGGVNYYRTDNAPRLNEIFANASWGNSFILPGDHIALRSPVKVPAGVALIGQGDRSCMVRDYVPYGDTFITFGPYSRIENLAVIAYGASGGTAMSCVATSADDAPMQNRLRNIEITCWGTSYWDCGLNIDAINGARGYGARDIVLDDIVVSHFTLYGIRLAALNMTRCSNMALVDFFSSEIAGVWITGAADNHNNGLLWQGASIGRFLFEYLNSANFQVSGFGEGWAMDENCSGVTVNAGGGAAPWSGALVSGKLKGYGNIVRAGFLEWRSAQ